MSREAKFAFVRVLALCALATPSSCSAEKREASKGSPANAGCTALFAERARLINEMPLIGRADQTARAEGQSDLQRNKRFLEFQERVESIERKIDAAGCRKRDRNVKPTDYIQPRKQFESAINDDSTNDSFVLVTVANGRSGAAKTGCIEANLLLGAIYMENGLEFDVRGMERARQLALSANSQRFSFRSAAALSNVSYATLGSANPDACKIIRSGRGAWRGDIGGQILPETE